MEIEKKSTYSKFLSIIMVFTSILLLILGAIGLVEELPDNISNTTILLFVMAFGLVILEKY